MGASDGFLSPSEAARRLGVSTKALRVYEQRGLVAPRRTAAGWRVYGPDELARAADIVALRALGLSLAQVARALRDEPGGLEAALSQHQVALNEQMRALAGTAAKVRARRAELLRSQQRRQEPATDAAVAFDLPWPWGGERFELTDIRRLNYIIGPLGSGKTRLALRLAEVLPGGAFLGLQRLDDAGAAARARLETDPSLEARVAETLAGLVADGATTSDALMALLVGLETEGHVVLVVDMVEQGLDHATQDALSVWLRRRRRDAAPLFLMTRSSAILDLARVGADEAIILCPANHSPPTRVDPSPGSPGYEAVATCLASPAVRARTEGVIAWRPAAA